MGRMSYTVYVWHTFFYFVILHGLGMDTVLGEKTRVPILAVITIVCCLPIFYGVERRMLRVKLRYSSEKEVLDLNTGKMVSVEEAARPRRGGSPPGPPSEAEAPTAVPPAPTPPAAAAPDPDRGEL
jgi:peptidoglycan/LPS O-acetylase OafA/YrhL